MWSSYTSEKRSFKNDLARNMFRGATKEIVCLLPLYLVAFRLLLGFNCSSNVAIVIPPSDVILKICASAVPWRTLL